MAPNANQDATRDVIDALGRLLATSCTLYLKSHNYHWNVTGSMFTTLHTLFETPQYTELALAVDEIAERIRPGQRGSRHQAVADPREERLDAS